ncbi:porin [Roseateles toxinivorans]|uniref:Putative porin n=1 Tax=Roseateles toxinivorans TaxID=270368 RepID=A0A4R6QGN2_9BURK|nr:porin [Roseateles toxinivorans]TDP62060.1 putative porin [Roseateles toxinivorans]
MKKQWFTCGTLLVISAAAPAQSSVTVFGVMDVSARYARNASGSLATVASGGNATSRFGVRGEENLGGGLIAGFWLESTVLGDNGGAVFWERRALASLAGPFGELRFGRDYTPAYRAFGASDPFGYLGVGALANGFNARSTTAIARAFGTNPTTVTRSNNSLQYLTPGGLNGFYSHVMIAPSEGSTGADGAYKNLGGRAGYAAGALDFSVYAETTKIAATGANFKQVGAAGFYNFGALKLSASVTRSEYLTSQHKNFLIGAIYSLGNSQFKASYSKVKQQGKNAAGASIDADGANAYALGYVYNLSKRTALYGTAARMVNSGKASYTVLGVPAGPTTSPSSAFELGIRHNF